MLDIIFERAQSNDPPAVVCKVQTLKNIEPDIITMYLVTSASIVTGNGLTSIDAATTYTHYRDGFIIRTTATLYIGATNRTHVKLFGNYNYDGLKISDSFNNRVEIRNEYGVLITDNGIAWLDGTYPPDAKNRAELAGLHAAPAVINPELENALMGDATNEERVQE